MRVTLAVSDAMTSAGTLEPELSGAIETNTQSKNGPAKGTMITIMASPMASATQVPRQKTREVSFPLPCPESSAVSTCTPSRIPMASPNITPMGSQELST